MTRQTSDALVKIYTLLIHVLYTNAQSVPIVVTTWGADGFQKASDAAFSKLLESYDRMESLIEGLSTCERLQCDGTVGYGGSPDESGETRLDAMVFNGPTHEMGAVASMANVKDAARVASFVMKYTKHSMLVGDEATRFAAEMGFKLEPLYTNQSRALYNSWKAKKCQPNFRKNVLPDSTTSCGPYKPAKSVPETLSKRNFFGHDTIGMVIVDSGGDIAAGTSTNGAVYKVPGRVGDSPIPGAGAYVDNDYGGAVGTGDGDVLMRFLPSYQAVESMRFGLSPQKSAEIAIMRILEKRMDFIGALIAVNKHGEYGAACHGIPLFHYSLRTRNFVQARVLSVKCI